MGRRNRKGRPVTGILLLDKPAGCTSNRALQQVKRLFNAQKAGHTGSLDPLATGVLPICLGEATKVSGLLLDSDKRYRVTASLGSRTETGDADGKVIATAEVPPMPNSMLSEAMNSLLGDIEQVPPMYSALKHEGRRLYEIARQGGEVERQPRRVTIHDLTLLNADQQHLEFEVHCSKGTYVRTLVEDLATRLGTEAHVSALRRLAVGPFVEAAGLHGMADIEAVGERGHEALDALLQPAAAALGDWPSVRVSGDSQYYLQRGQPVQVSAAPTAGQVAIFGPEDRLIGIGEVLDDGRVAPRRILRS